MDRNQNSNWKVAMVSAALIGLSTFAQAAGDELRCPVGQELIEGKCSWDEMSQDCQTKGGLHWIETYNRCQCKPGLAWNDDIEQCWEYCSKGTNWDFDKQMCIESHLSRQCRELKKGQYYIEFTKSCKCNDGLFWSAEDNTCVDLDARLKNLQEKIKEKAKELTVRRWYISKKLERHQVHQNLMMFVNAQNEKAAKLRAWTKAGCTQGQVVKDEVCVWSNRSKVCQAEWRQGLYYLGSGKGCACKPGFFWNKQQVKCTSISSSEPDKFAQCGKGRAFDQKQMKCRWTKNSRTCHSRGALHFHRVNGVDVCACPKSWTWTGKACQAADGSMNTCDAGKFFDGLTQTCEWTKNSLKCQQRSGLYYQQELGKCFCETSHEWNESISGCQPRQLVIDCELGEEYSYSEKSCLQTKNSMKCVAWGALYYDKAQKTCKCASGIFDTKQVACVSDFDGAIAKLIKTQQEADKKARELKVAKAVETFRKVNAKIDD